MKRRQFLTLSLLTGASVVFAGCFKAGPGKTVEKFYRAMGKGETENALSLVSSSSLGGLPVDKMKLLLDEASKDMQNKQGIKSFKINSEEITGDTATVNYTVEFGDGSTETDTAQLVKENEEWKLSPTGK